MARLGVPARLSSTAPLVSMQPTMLCNLNCPYCHLHHQASARVMPVEVADAVAEAVAPWSEIHPVRVLWRNRETLATGLARFAMFARFARWFGPGRGHRVRHGVQTNSALWYADLSGADVFLCRPCRANRYLEN